MNLQALTNYSVLLDQALRSDYITEKDLVSLNEWRKDPRLGRESGRIARLKWQVSRVQVSKPSAEQFAIEAIAENG